MSLARVTVCLSISLMLAACSQEASLRRAPTTTDEAPTAPPDPDRAPSNAPTAHDPSQPSQPGTPETTPATPKPASALSWDQHVKPLLEERCSECHHAGKSIDLGKFPFMKGTGAENADRLVAALAPTGAMPPAPREKLIDPNVLKTIQKWRSDGMYP